MTNNTTPTTEEKTNDKPYIKATRENFDRAIIQSLKAEPFYAAFSMSISKEFVKGCKTAFVSLNSRGKPYMGFDPDFFEQVINTGDIKHFTCQIYHELLHIMMGHLSGRRPEKGQNAKMHNIAMDAAIDEFLIGEHCKSCPIHDGCIRLQDGSFGEKFPDIQKGTNYEIVYEMMKDQLEEEKKQQKEKGESGEGESGEGESGEGGLGDLDSRDDHDKWGEALDENGQPVEMTEQDQARLEAEIKQALQSAYEKAGRGSNDRWGSVPREVQQSIMQILEGSGAIDWEVAFRNALKCSQLSTKRTSWLTRNRRMPWKAPGGRRKRTIPNCLIAIDESGSVDDALLTTFGDTLPDLVELANFTLIKFDTQIYESKEYAKGDVIEYSRQCTGGTCFDAPTDYANDNDFDMLVIITDMCAPAPKPCHYPRIWITDPSNFESHFQTNEVVLCLDES